jgi:hypothetical protein
MEKCKHGVPGKCGICEPRPRDTPEVRRSRIRQRADSHSPATDAEREGLEAIYAYEEALSDINDKRTYAGRTWPMVKKVGVIAAIEGIVTRPLETRAYRILIEIGLEDKTFEAVVLRYPTVFSAEAVAACERRLRETRDGTAPKRLPPLPS